MTDWRGTVFRSGLDVLHMTGASRLVRSVAPPRGVIFTLHHVRPETPPAFAPNRILEITPDFLDRALARVREAGLDLVTLDEAARRLRDGDEGPFAAFTLDDGYRDNAEHAAPIFRRHGCPYTIYIPSEFAEGRGELWWKVLETAIATGDAVDVEIGGERHGLPTRDEAERWTAFRTLYWPFRHAAEAEQRSAMHRLAASAGIDVAGLCRSLVMGWEEIAALAADPLCTIGAHTAGHFACAKLGMDEARAEMVRGADAIEARLGARPRHFSFPYGDPGSAGPRDFALARDAGFETAVTTRPGVLYTEHAAHLTALPRVSLNGDYQAMRYVDVFLSGAAFLLYNRGRKLNVA